MLKHFLYALTFLLLPLSWLNADTYSMDAITQSLQSEYQQQLRQKRVKTKRILPKRQVVKPIARRQPPRLPRAEQAHRPPVPLRTQSRVPVPSTDSLFAAATNGNVGAISRLLQQGLNANSANSERETALHMAAARGHYSAVIFLVNHGASVHSRTVSNWLPIHHATRFRHANIANYLMQRGSSPHARTSDGKSAIDMARTVRDQRLLNIFGAR